MAIVEAVDFQLHFSSFFAFILSPYHAGAALKVHGSLLGIVLHD
jgi:hypothetical protein